MVTTSLDAQEDLDISPLKIVGYEGIFGAISMLFFDTSDANPSRK